MHSAVMGSVIFSGLRNLNILQIFMMIPKVFINVQCCYFAGTNSLNYWLPGAEYTVTAGENLVIALKSGGI